MNVVFLIVFALSNIIHPVSMSTKGQVIQYLGGSLPCAWGCTYNPEWQGNIGFVLGTEPDAGGNGELTLNFPRSCKNLSIETDVNIGKDVRQTKLVFQQGKHKFVRFVEFAPLTTYTIKTPTFNGVTIVNITPDSPGYNDNGVITIKDAWCELHR